MPAPFGEPVECCECQDLHTEKDRLQVESEDWPGCTVSACPACKALEFCRIYKEKDA